MAWASQRPSKTFCPYILKLSHIQIIRAKTDSACKQGFRARPPRPRRGGQGRGEYLKAFAAAHEAFKSDPLIPAEKKRLENYNVEFRQSGDLYHVLFSAKRLPHERELDGGESELGKDVMYTIRKADYQIVKRLFYR